MQSNSEMPKKKKSDKKRLRKFKPTSNKNCFPKVKANLDSSRSQSSKVHFCASAKDK
jgi:hypothetical protein